MWPFFNPTIKVAAFCLRGWCMLNVFLLPAFIPLGYECQDLLSLCNGMHVCTDYTSVYTPIWKNLGGMESEPMLTPREKSSLPEKFSSEEDHSHDVASHMTVNPKHYQQAIPEPFTVLMPIWSVCLLTWQLPEAIWGVCIHLTTTVLMSMWGMSTQLTKTVLMSIWGVCSQLTNTVLIAIWGVCTHLTTTSVDVYVRHGYSLDHHQCWVLCEVCVLTWPPPVLSSVWGVSTHLTNTVPMSMWGVCTPLTINSVDVFVRCVYSQDHHKCWCLCEVCVLTWPPQVLMSMWSMCTHLTTTSVDVYVKYVYSLDHHLCWCLCKVCVLTWPPPVLMYKQGVCLLTWPTQCWCLYEVCVLKWPPPVLMSLWSVCTHLITTSVDVYERWPPPVLMFKHGVCLLTWPTQCRCLCEVCVLKWPPLVLMSMWSVCTHLTTTSVDVYERYVYLITTVLMAMRGVCTHRTTTDANVYVKYEYSLDQHSVEVYVRCAYSLYHQCWCFCGVYSVYHWIVVYMECTHLTTSEMIFVRLTHTQLDHHSVDVYVRHVHTSNHQCWCLCKVRELP